MSEKPRKKGNPIVLLVILILVVAVVVVFLVPNCIVEGTPIDTPEGPRAIENLRVGDRVWTLSPTGRREMGKVRSVRAASAGGYCEILLQGGSVLRATPSHPVRTDQGWRRAGTLRSGDRVRSTSGWSTVDRVTHLSRIVRVFDLEVAPNHNFFAAGVLVHNKTSARHFNETSAVSGLRSVTDAESQFRDNDLDGNSVRDFWVADLQGLNAILGPGGGAIQTIQTSLARADARPKPGAGDTKYATGLGEKGPKNGYHFAALRFFEDESGAKTRYDPGNGRNEHRYGFIAWPAEYESTGVRAFITNETGNVYWKDFERDLAPGEIDVFPHDPKKAGWAVVD